MSVVFLLHKTWWQFSDVLASYWGDEAYTYICIHIYIHTYIHTYMYVYELWRLRQGNDCYGMED